MLMKIYSDFSWHISLKLLKSEPRIVASALLQELVTISQNKIFISSFVGQSEVEEESNRKKK